MLARQIADDGEHLILRAGGEKHQLWLRSAISEGDPVASVIPFDKFMAHRNEAVVRFRRHIARLKARAVPGKERQHTSNIRALQALDGRLNGASYRAIAEILFGPARVAREPWKTAPARDATIRFARKGFALMRGKYRDLLHRRTRK